MTFNQTSQTSFDILVDLQGKKSFSCKDAILFANTELTHFEIFFRSGLHKITFNMPYEAEQKDVSYGGINAYMICYGVKDEIESVIRSFQLFFYFESGEQSSRAQNGQYTYNPDLAEASVEFLNVSMNWQLEEREIKTVPIDESLIKSGDHFGVFWLDGTSSFIMYGSGSYIDHSVMALWFEDGLYVVQSNTPIISRSPFSSWFEHHSRAHVAWNPLREDIAAKFNETAAREFFYEMEGTVYGYHNFMYGWIDTAEDNWPPILP